MVRFIIVRHGQTTYNRVHRYQGQCDSPLSDLGIRQAEETAKHLTRTYQIDAIYASDLSRACDTAAPTAKLLGLPVNALPALREVNAGVWENRLVADVQKEDAERVAASRNDPGTFRYPGGETFQEVYERASRCIEEIAKKHDGKTVLVVSHGGTIRALLCIWSGRPMSLLREIPVLQNTSITVVEYENGKITPKTVGDNSHLPEELK